MCAVAAATSHAPGAQPALGRGVHQLEEHGVEARNRTASRSRGRSPKSTRDGWWRSSTRLVLTWCSRYDRACGEHQRPRLRLVDGQHAAARCAYRADERIHAHDGAPRVAQGDAAAPRAQPSLDLRLGAEPGRWLSEVSWAIATVCNRHSVGAAECGPRPCSHPRFSRRHSSPASFSVRSFWPAYQVAARVTATSSTTAVGRPTSEVTRSPSADLLGDRERPLLDAERPRARHQRPEQRLPHQGVDQADDHRVPGDDAEQQEDRRVGDGGDQPRRPRRRRRCCWPLPLRIRPASSVGHRGEGHGDADRDDQLGEDDRGPAAPAWPAGRRSSRRRSPGRSRRCRR